MGTTQDPQGDIMRQKWSIHQQPDVTARNEDQFQFSVLCARVIFPLHTRTLGQV